MPKYFVRLEVQIGVYEKHTGVLVEADNEDLAELTALAAESHGSANITNDGRLVWWDCYGGMAYTVDGIKEVSDSNANVLVDLWFNTIHYDYEWIKACLSEPEELDAYLELIK